MSDHFDPHYKWLGIPRNEQPPNHYRLLGIPPFESDREVIRNAADRLMSYLKAQSGGPHADFSQRLLNEVSAAKVCLLTADNKQSYDAQLRPASETEEVGRKSVHRRFDTNVVLRPKESDRRGKGQSSRDRNHLVVSIFFALMCLVIIRLVFLTFKYRQDIREFSDEVSALQTDNGLKDTENRRLSNQLSKLGLEPRELDMNSGREFDGKSYVETSVKFDGSHSLTVEAWVQPRLVDGPYRTVIGDKESSGFALIKHENIAVWRFQIRDDQAYVGVNSDEPAIAGQWVHVAGVYDKERNELRICVDGTSKAEDFSGNFEPSNRPILIGADPQVNNGIERFFDGAIDEVRISNTAKYPAGDYMPKRPLESDKNTLALYHFDEAMGERVVDSSPHKRRGINHGARRVPLPMTTTATIVLWNQHNGHIADRGTRRCTAVLYHQGEIVWRQGGIEMEWSRSAEAATTVFTDVTEFDSIEIRDVEGIRKGAGLTEIEVFQNGINLARNGDVTASAFHVGQPDDQRFLPKKAIDGIRNSGKFGVGYWLLPDEGDLASGGRGWIKIDFSAQTGAVVETE